MAVKGATQSRSTGKARTKAEREAKSAAAKSTGTAKAKAKSNGGTKRADARAKDAELIKKVEDLRGKDKSWSEIGKALSITPGKAAFLHMVASVKPKDKLKKGDDESVAKQAIELRLSGLSWGEIAARAYHLSIPEPRLKALATEHATAAQKKELAKNVASKRAADKPKAGSRGR